MLVSLTKACVLVEVFCCQVISIIVGLWPHQATTGHFYHAHLIWELSWYNAYIGHNKYGHILLLKRSPHQWADYSRWDSIFFFKSTIYYTGLVGRPRWNSIIDVTWRTVDKGQIYQRAHWFLVMMLIDHYRHLRFVDLPVINGNSLMAVACIYWHHRHPYTTCYLNCLFYFSVVLYCSRIMQGRLTCHWSCDFKCSVFCNGCHILSLITVDRNVICSLTLGWANCGSTCAASALYAASGQFSPDATVPTSARLTLTLSTTLVPFPSSSPSPRHSATPPQPSQNDHAWRHRWYSHPLDGRRPRWQCRYWLQQVGLIFVAVPPFSPFA